MRWPIARMCSPADYCDQLEIPKGSSYAQAVEEVRQWCAEQQKGELEDEDDDDDGLLCEHCAGRPTCIVAKVSVNELEDADWDQFRRGSLKIAPEDMRNVLILCDRCAERPF